MSDLRRLSNDAVLDMSTGMYTNPLCYTPEADADAVRAWIRSIPPLVAPVQAEAYAPEHDAAHLDRWLTVARDEADTLRAKLAEVERRLALSDAALAEQIANRTKAETERDAAVRRAESLVGTFTSRNAIAKICGALGLASADTYEEDADAIIAAIGKLRDEAKAASGPCPVERKHLVALQNAAVFSATINALAGWALEEEARR